MSASLEPTPEQIQALAARPADEPVVMINLLQFRAERRQTELPPIYAGGRRDCSASPAPSATRANRRRSSSARAKSRGATPLSWSSIRRAAFLDMVTNEEHRKVHEHRAGGLDRGDLIATSIWTGAE